MKILMCSSREIPCVCFGFIYSQIIGSRLPSHLAAEGPWRLSLALGVESGCAVPPLLRAVRPHWRGPGCAATAATGRRAGSWAWGLLPWLPALRCPLSKVGSILSSSAQCPHLHTWILLTLNLSVLHSPDL